MGEIIQAVADGDLLPSEGERLTGMVKAKAELTALREIEERLLRWRRRVGVVGRHDSGREAGWDRRLSRMPRARLRSEPPPVRGQATIAPAPNGGDRQAAAIAYTLIEIAKLNDIDPQAWLTDIRAAGRPHPRDRR
jgi:hypothetical protein